VKRALVCALLLLSACGGKGQARLEGNWKGTKTEGVPKEAQVAADDFARNTSLEFKGDQLTIHSPRAVQSGKYKIKKEDKTSLVVVTDKDGDADPQTLTFVDPKTLKWAVFEGKVIVFTKQ
jgi:hypothetical protein